MRQILVDHARKKHRLKRGGVQSDLPLDDALQVGVDDMNLDLVDLDDASNASKKWTLSRLVSWNSNTLAD